VTLGCVRVKLAECSMVFLELGVHGDCFSFR